VNWNAADDKELQLETVECECRTVELIPED